MSLTTPPQPVLTLDRPAPLVPSRVLFGNPTHLSPAIAPDGRRLAWIAPADGVLNVWVRDLHGDPGTEQVVTDDRDRGVREFCWAPDGTRILYLRDEGGDEQWQLRDVDLASGVHRDLTPGKTSQTRIVKISKHRPDAILVAINADRPQLHDVYRIDLATGERTKVLDNPGFVGFVADDDLIVRAAIAPTPDGGTIIMFRDGSDAEFRPLLQVGYEDALTTIPVAVSPDGARLLCITSSGADTARLVWIDTASGAFTVVAEDPTYDVAGAVVHHDTAEPRLVVFQRDRRTPLVLDASIAEDIAALTALGGDLDVLGSDAADRVWIAATSHDNGPVRYYVYDRAVGEPQLLFSHHPDLDDYTLAPMEPVTVTARDGLQLHGYVTFPVGVPRRDLPTVLLVHGGPWHRDTWGYQPQVQWLANRGYLVIQVNFRGSTGYGRAFLNAGNRQWGARMHDDLLDAVSWAVEQGFADPARIGIMGGSYGGYAALIGAAFTPDVFACAVALAGPVNLNTMITSIPPYWAPIIAQAKTRIGDPDTEPDFLWSRSPLSRAGDIRCPVLAAYGDNDPRVPAGERQQLQEVLQEHGIALVCLTFADEGHGLVKPGNREEFYARAEQFLAAHLGGRSEDPAAPVEPARM